jgi:predicted nucleotidyltransferase component of viral defense system
MLTQPQVQRFAMESGLRDIMIAEKEVVLTFLLQLLSERGLLDRVAFKGETCLRKMICRKSGTIFDGPRLYRPRRARPSGREP